MASQLKDRLKTARTNARLTQQQIADEFGITREAVAGWERGSSKPEVDKIQIIAALTGVPATLLLDDQLDISAIVSTKSRVSEQGPIRAYSVRVVEGGDGVDPSTDIMVPEVDVHLSGGHGAFIPEFVETKFEMPFQLWWFQKHNAKPENVRLMKVDGHSMERTLYHGDRVAVDLGDSERVRDGRVYALVVGSDAKVKRLFNTRDGGLRIVSDNTDKNLYPDEIVPGSEMGEIVLLGKVIDKSGSGGL